MSKASASDTTSIHPILTIYLIGVIHEGTAKGKWETIGGVNCYVGTPSGDYSKDKAILYLSDVFGMQLINNQVSIQVFSSYLYFSNFV